MTARSGLALAGLLFSVVAGCGASPAPESRDVPVAVGSVGVDPLTESPVIMLEEENGARILPIWIGMNEARSIVLGMESVPSPRPNTHDLAKRLLTQLDANVERVVVTELRSGTYYAVLVVITNGRRLEIDARPSDAIAIALRTDAPVFVREALFQDATDDTLIERSEEAIDL